MLVNEQQIRELIIQILESVQVKSLTDLLIELGVSDNE